MVSRRDFMLVLLLTSVGAVEKCYFLDGSAADNSYRRCDLSTEFGPCCALNKKHPDTCLSSGLCYAQDDGYKGFVYSNGCSDPSGNANECPNICPELTDPATGKKAKTYNILQCNSRGNYCCRVAGDKENCCSNENAAVVVDIGYLDLPTVTVSVSGSVTQTSAPTQADTDAKVDDEVECPKDNTAVVGGAVGGVLGAALLGCLGAIAALLMRRPKAVPAETDPSGPARTWKFVGPPISPSGPSELNAPSVVHEVEGNFATPVDPVVSPHNSR